MISSNVDTAVRGDWIAVRGCGCWSGNVPASHWRRGSAVLGAGAAPTAASNC